MVLFGGESLGVFALALAYPVEGVFDGFPVQDAVGAVDALPGADGAQLRCDDRGLDAEADQVLEVIIGHVARNADSRFARFARFARQVSSCRLLMTSAAGLLLYNSASSVVDLDNSTDGGGVM